MICPLVLRRFRGRAIDLEEIVAELKALGMDGDHARLYLHLLETGPAKAGTLAALSEFSRSKVYRTLSDMTSEGSAVVELGQPRIYRATDPAALLDQIEERWRRGVEQVRSARERLAGPLRSLEADPSRERTGPSWRILQGRLRILEELLDRIERTGEVDLLVPSDQLGAVSTSADRFWERARSLDRDGDLDLRILVSIPDDTRDETALPEPGSLEIRVVEEAGVGFFAVFDRETVLSGMGVDPRRRADAEGDVAVVTDSDHAVQRHRLLFETLWEQAPSIREVRPELAEEDR